MPPRWSALIGRARKQTTGLLLALVCCCASLSSPWPCLAQQPGEEQAASAAPHQSLRLRIYWDSRTEAALWSCRLSLTDEKGLTDERGQANGKISDVFLWGGEADAARVDQTLPGKVTITARQPRQLVGFDLTTNADPASTLRVELKTSPSAVPVVAEIPLGTVALKPHQTALGDAGGTLQVFRAPDDRLRVQTEQQQLIFAPGDSFQFTLEAALADAAPHSPVDLQAELLRGRSSTVLPGGTQQRVNFPRSGPVSAPFEIPLPQEEGVYTVRLRALKPSGLRLGWGKSSGKPLAERTIQVVVWDEQSAKHIGEQRQVVVDIDPASSRWWKLIPEWKWTRRVPWLSKDPLGSAPPEVVTVPGGRMVRLATATKPSESPWQAYPLPIDRPGAPHLLEIEVPDNQPQELSITLFDRDAIGRASPLGDSLCAMTGDRFAPPDAPRTTIRRLFWPQTDSPMLVVSNHSLNQQARYGRIRVTSLSRVDHNQQQAVDQERDVIACVTAPRLVNAMQAGLMPSRDGRYVHEDWHAFYATATRLADHIEQAGFNGAMVTVASSEGVIYPTRVFGRQTGLDWELVATGVNDLPRKDLLELLLREFDRRGLKLTPVLRFEAALPSIEQLRTTTDRAAFDCRDATGQARSATSTRYNPLHPVVQQSAVSAVEELVQKCAGHKCFNGIAIDLTPNSHLVLPGDRWCVDDTLLDAFLRDTQLSWPTGLPRDARNTTQAITGAWSDAWRKWRSAQMTALYSAMAQKLTKANPEAELTLLASRLFDDSDGHESIRPRLDSGSSVDELLLQRGIDRRRLATLPNLSFKAPQFTEHSSNLVLAAYSLQINGLFRNYPTAAQEASGLYLTHEHRSAELPGFRLRSPFGAERTFTRTALAQTTFGSKASRALVETVLATPNEAILEGGDACPLAVDPRRVALRRMLRRLPPGSETTTVSSRQPLNVKSMGTGPQRYLLAGNLSPWPIDASLSLDAPQPCTSRELNGDEEGQSVTQIAAGRHVLPVTIEPYDLEIRLVDSAHAVATGVQMKVQPNAGKATESQVESLGRRDLYAKRAFTGSGNLSFEVLDGSGMPVGWEWDVAHVRKGEISVNQNAPFDGHSALSITAGEQPVRVTSRPFASPATRQLVMKFHVRPDRIASDGQLTIMYLSGEGRREPFSVIPAKVFGDGDQWRPFVFSETVPLMPNGMTRIAFEARGMSVSIDKLELHSLAFPLTEDLPQESKRQRLALVKSVQFAANSALADGRLTDCHRVLDSYWARFLMDFTPETQQRKPDITAESGKKPAKEETPKVSSRWKSYVPRFLRN